MESVNASELADQFVDGQSDIWVFAYGSLIWHPGFEFMDQQLALLRGYHRRFCIYSHHHRGTPDRQGLVLGLDRGGSCRGVAFQVAAAQSRSAMIYLIERELVAPVYQPRCLRVQLVDQAISAWTFVVDQRHHQYAGKLSVETAAQLIRQAIGKRGPNREYLENTVHHLEQLGIQDSRLRSILEKVEELDAATPWHQADLNA